MKYKNIRTIIIEDGDIDEQVLSRYVGRSKLRSY